VHPNLQKKYIEEVIPKVKEKFNIKNIMAIPKIEKVVVNMGVGGAIQDIKLLDNAVEVLTEITGQKPSIRRSRIAISNFKLRKNLPVGCMVCLRREKMYEFLDRLINVALPRVRDFNGVSKKSFDKQGNYSLGLSEQSIFPEIDTGRIKHQQGMDITIVFNKGPVEQTIEILSLLGVPFSKK